jgi:transposase-like protein
MANDLANPIFSNEAKARAWLEARVWPNGPVCPHCGSDAATRLEGKAHRPGLFQCNDCREQFTVTVGTLFERSKIPLTKWLMAIYLMSASKKGMSTNQLSRMLGLPYKTAWFMTHRIREAMREGKLPGGLGGQNKVVEAGSYVAVGREFTGHGSVNHSIDEYVRHGGFIHTNTVEGYFSILKRGIVGTFHHVSQQHLKRYLGEFDFRYNTRTMSDMERAEQAAAGIVGKRLTYRRTDAAEHA